MAEKKGRGKIAAKVEDLIRGPVEEYLRPFCMLSKGYRYSVGLKFEMNVNYTEIPFT